MGGSCARQGRWAARLGALAATMSLLTTSAAAHADEVPARPEWFEFSWGLRLAHGSDNRRQTTSTGFAYMDVELFWPLWPEIPLFKRGWILQPLFVGEIMIGFGDVSYTAVDKVGDQVVGSSDQTIDTSYLSALLAVGAQAVFGEDDRAPTVHLLYGEIWDRSFFNYTTGDDLDAIQDVTGELIVGATVPTRVGRLEGGASLRGGWYRLGLRTKASFNQFAWFDYRLEVTHQARDAFDYLGVALRVAVGGSL